MIPTFGMEQHDDTIRYGNITVHGSQPNQLCGVAGEVVMSVILGKVPTGIRLVVNLAVLPLCIGSC
jgi:hypothetical protein